MSTTSRSVWLLAVVFAQSIASDTLAQVLSEAVARAVARTALVMRAAGMVSLPRLSGRTMERNGGLSRGGQHEAPRGENAPGGVEDLEARHPSTGSG